VLSTAAAVATASAFFIIIVFLNWRLKRDFFADKSRLMARVAQGRKKLRRAKW
jgi:hypothetical protein